MIKYLSLLIILCFSFVYGAEPIIPIPKSISYDRAKAKLGESLFFDPILSKDRTISCASCHIFSASGADSKQFSLGYNGAKEPIHTPTVYNAIFNFTQFWNGRVQTLDEQALKPIHNPIEMGLSLDEATQRLKNNKFYQTAFFKITKRTTINSNDIAEVIAEYEKTLITPNGKFDQYLRGQAKISQNEREGYYLFKTLGCVSCHNGINVGGNSFQKMGAIIPIKHNPSVPDRYAITRLKSDKNVFKVPTLRNIALTAPYFHDGSASTLNQAVFTMAYHNLGLKLSTSDVEKLVAFLQTLSGESPKSKGNR